MVRGELIADNQVLFDVIQVFGVYAIKLEVPHHATQEFFQYLATVRDRPMLKAGTAYRRLPAAAHLLDLTLQGSVGSKGELGGAGDPVEIRRAEWKMD